MHGTRHEVTIAFRLRWLAHAAVATALACGLLVVLLRVLLDAPLGAGFAGAWHDLVGLRRALLPSIGFAVLVWLLLAGAATAFIAHQVAHRVAAPLFRLEHLAEGLRHGDLALPPVLRHGDQLPDLARALGELEGSLVAQLRAAGEPLAQLERCGEELDDTGDAGHPERAAAALAQLDALLERIERALADPDGT